MSINGALAPAAAVVAVDVGKTKAAVLVSDAQRHRLLGPLEFSMTAGGVAQVIIKSQAVLPAGVTRVGVEAAGHYHRPLAAPSVWPGWEVVELNPAHVAEQRRVMGRRRVKTDALDLEAITELLLTGRGLVVTEPPTSMGELTAWAAHRHRRVATRTATKNQLLGQLDRCFPGLTLAVPDVLGTKVGRLVAEHFADPHRLAGLGASRFIRFAAARGLQVRRPVADRLVAAARDALPRRMLRWPGRSWPRIWRCWPTWTSRSRPWRPGWLSWYRPARSRRCCPCPVGAWCGSATTAPRSATRPAGPGRRQLYRASGLSPAQYESAGRRRDGAISREGSVQLRRALIDLGIGLWLQEPAAKRYGQTLRARGKKGGIIACAMAHRANKIAYAMVRDQTGYQPDRWA